MKKLKLNLDDLTVDSFHVMPEGMYAGRGTVMGYGLSVNFCEEHQGMTCGPTGCTSCDGTGPITDGGPTGDDTCAAGCANTDYTGCETNCQQQCEETYDTIETWCNDTEAQWCP